MRQMWVEMPDSMIPYLSKESRTELMDYVDMKMKASTMNLLSSETVVDTLTHDFISVKLSASSVLEMRLLKRTDGKPLLCSVQTFYGPAPSSEIHFYDTYWQPVTGTFIRQLTDSELLARPVDMDDEEWGRVMSYFVPKMTVYKLSDSDESITVSYSYIFNSEDDKVNMNHVVLQKKLNWNGQIFK